MIHAIMNAMLARLAPLPLVALVALAGMSTSCTRLGFDDAASDGSTLDAPAGEQTLPIDSSVDAPLIADDAELDQQPTQPICDWTVAPAAGAAVLLDQLNTDSNETDPFVAADGLTLYFGSKRNNVLATMVARRPSRDQPFGLASAAPAPINVADGTNERFELDATGSFAVLSGSRPGFDSDLFVLSLTNGAVKPISDVQTIGREVDPHLALKGQQLWFARQLSGDGGYEILRAERVGASFANAKAVAELNAATPSNSNATLDERGLLVVFSGCPSGQDCDIYYATRGDTSKPFSTPRRWPGSDGSASELEPFISRDGCELFFARDDDPKGGWGLYRAGYKP